MPASYWEHAEEERKSPFWLFVILAFAGVIAIGAYVLSQGRVETREVVEEVDFIDVSEPEPEPEPEEPEPESVDVPEIEIPDLPTTRVDPVQDELDQRELAENPLSLVDEGDEGADAFQLGSASRNRGLLRGAPPGSNAEGRYWSLVQTEIRQHLYNYPEIDRVEWTFDLTLEVGDDARIRIVAVENIEPGTLRSFLENALAEFDFVSQPPPEGVRRTNRIRLRNIRE